MINSNLPDSDGFFWSLQGRYSRILKQQLKNALQQAGHKSVAFYYLFSSGRLLYTTYQQTPLLRDLIQVFEGSYTFNKKSAVSQTLQQARNIRFTGLRQLAATYVDTNLSNINQEAYDLWQGTLSSLDPENAAGEVSSQETAAQQDQAVIKFLIRYYTLKNLVKDFEKRFSSEQIAIEAEKSSAAELYDREHVAIEAIGNRYFPELFTTSDGQAAAPATKESAPSLEDLVNLMQEKHEWLGTQKELAELFIELERKGWVKEKLFRTIQASFTKSDTIDQVLKPNRDHVYPEVFTKKYKSKFDTIKHNPKSTKRK